MLTCTGNAGYEYSNNTVIPCPIHHSAYSPNCSPALYHLPKPKSSVRYTFTVELVRTTCTNFLEQSPPRVPPTPIRNLLALFQASSAN